MCSSDLQTPNPKPRIYLANMIGKVWRIVVADRPGFGRSCLMRHFGDNHDNDRLSSRILDSGCLYKILGLSKECSDKDIKQAYRSLTKSFHPDVNRESNAKDVYTKVVEAYTVLINKNTRAKYDSAKESHRPWSADDLDGEAYENYKSRQRQEQNRRYSYWEEGAKSTYSEEFSRKYNPGAFHQQSKVREPPITKASALTFVSCFFICGMVLYSIEEKRQRRLENELKLKQPDFSAIRKNSSKSDGSNKNAFIMAVSPDGVIADTPGVQRARFNQLAEEFAKKNIVIEVVPNRLHPRYQKLLRDPDHIKQLNSSLDNSRTDWKISKSESVLKMDSLRKRITLHEHYELFQDGVRPNTSFDKIQKSSISKAKSDDFMVDDDELMLDSESAEYM